MLGEIMMNILEWIGTVAFAASGALVAIASGLDVFGVLVVGCITATGGGIMRDILVGVTPPTVFSSYEFIIIAAVTAACVFVVSYTHATRFEFIKSKVEQINLLFDSLGLAVFTVSGIEHVSANGNCTIVAMLTAGVITGVGGGVLRDVLVNEKPYILTKHVYALASLVGCVLYYLIGVHYGHTFAATLISVSSVLIIRVLAAKMHWKLPKVSIDGHGDSAQ